MVRTDPTSACRIDRVPSTSIAWQCMFTCTRGDDHAVIRIDQVIGGIGKESGAFAGCCPLTAWVRMRSELWLNCGCCAKRCVIQNVQIFLHSTRCTSWINCAAIPIFFWCGVLFVICSSFSRYTDLPIPGFKATLPDNRLQPPKPPFLMK